MSKVERTKIGELATNSKSVTVRMPTVQLDRLDEWAAEQPDKPTRPEAVRRLVEKALVQAQLEQLVGQRG